MIGRRLTFGWGATRKVLPEACGGKNVPDVSVRWIVDDVVQHAKLACDHSYGRSGLTITDAAFEVPVALLYLRSIARVAAPEIILAVRLTTTPPPEAEQKSSRAPKAKEAKAATAAKAPRPEKATTKSARATKRKPPPPPPSSNECSSDSASSECSSDVSDDESAYQHRPSTRAKKAPSLEVQIAVKGLTALKASPPSPPPSTTPQQPEQPQPQPPQEPHQPQQPQHQPQTQPSQQQQQQQPPEPEQPEPPMSHDRVAQRLVQLITASTAAPAQRIDMITRVATMRDSAPRSLHVYFMLARDAEARRDADGVKLILEAFVRARTE
jgi:hypothetical protein